MAADDTRNSIMKAAERLYADRGFADVTLRDIVAEAGVNLAAVNYHFGSKDELITELYITRGQVLNRERFSQLRQAEERDGGTTSVENVLRALVGPYIRGCLGEHGQRSDGHRFMIRAALESIAPIRKIRNREIGHLKRFAAAVQRALPQLDDADVYWGLHFSLAMAQQTIRDSERLMKLSDGLCDVSDVDGIIDRIVRVGALAMTAKLAA